MQKAVARWSGQKVKFEIRANSGHNADVDEPPAFGDDDGMRPTEMLLGALGACTGINAVLLLKKFRQPLTALDVEVEGDQEKEWPHAFTEIRINFKIGWEGEQDKQLVENALDMAVNKYCPVDATLSHGTKITVKSSDA
jgi:putative redox protein